MLAFAQRNSLERVKITSQNFDLDYKRDKAGRLILMSEKAIIRSMGKVSKVPIGVGQEYATFEDAEKAVKKYWSEYYKKVRSKRTDKQRAAEARRQKRYRDKLKAKELDIHRNQ